MKTLLIVTYHFPPSAASGSHRLLGFARHLPKFGWRAVVVAPPTLPWEPADAELSARVPAETTVYRAPYWGRPLAGPLGRIAPFAAWLPRGWAACRRAVRAERPDALLTSGPPHLVHLLGHRLRRRQGPPWVADFRDPWVATHGRAADRSAATRRDAWLESLVMGRADAIVANAPGARDRLREAMPGHAHKMVAITNGYDPESFDDLGPPAPPDGTLRVVHPGEVYGERNPAAFLDAVRALVDERPFGGRPLAVRFMGKWLERPDSELAAEVRRRGLEGVVAVGGAVPHAEALRAMVRADVLLLLDSPGRRLGVPAKLYEYLGAGRPILALGESDGDLARVLRASGVAHRIAHPKDPAAIQRALVELLDGAGGPGPGPGRLDFTRERTAGRLAAVLDGLLAPLDDRAGPPRHALTNLLAMPVERLPEPLDH